MTEENKNKELINEKMMEKLDTWKLQQLQNYTELNMWNNVKNIDDTLREQESNKLKRQLRDSDNSWRRTYSNSAPPKWYDDFTEAQKEALTNGRSQQLLPRFKDYIKNK